MRGALVCMHICKIERFLMQTPAEKTRAWLIPVVFIESVSMLGTVCVTMLNYSRCNMYLLCFLKNSFQIYIF